jgi:hypothetical protein
LIVERTTRVVARNRLFSSEVSLHARSDDRAELVLARRRARALHGVSQHRTRAFR